MDCREPSEAESKSVRGRLTAWPIRAGAREEKSGKRSRAQGPERATAPLHILENQLKGIVEGEGSGELVPRSSWKNKGGVRERVRYSICWVTILVTPQPASQAE